MLFMHRIAELFWLHFAQNICRKHNACEQFILLKHLLIFFLYLSFIAMSHLTARKNKKLIKMKVHRAGASEPTISNMPVPVVPRSMPQLVPTMLSILKAIEPEIIYSGYDSTLPDTSSRLMSTLNRLGGQQVVSAVKWAKSLPGNRKSLYHGFPLV